jgi:hypothetical protein
MLRLLRSSRAPLAARAPLALVAFVALAAPLLAACQAGVDSSDALAAPDAPRASDALGAAGAPLVAATAPRDVRVYRDRAAGCSFAYPAGLHAVTDHYDLALPPRKFKHAVTLSGASGPVLRVEVWHNDEGLAQEAWFDKYMAFTLAGKATSSARAVGLARAPAIVVDQPRIQAPARRLAVVAIGERVFRITCLDREDPASREAFETVARSFDAEVAR